MFDNWMWHYMQQPGRFETEGIGVPIRFETGVRIEVSRTIVFILKLLSILTSYNMH